MIQKNPFFGDPFFLLQLEDLRQGQGIIDLMNAYATIAMSYGVVGLCLFLGSFLIAMWNAYRLVKRSAGSDPDLSLLGANLIACITGMLFMLATAGTGTGHMLYFLLGLIAGYAHQLGQTKQAARASWFPEGPDHNPARR